MLENKIAILILFFNRLTETEICINSFIPCGQQIYVLNNGSDKNTWEELKSQFKDYTQIKFIHSDKNLGVSAGRNLLIRECREPWLLMVDNDISIRQTKDWVNIFESWKNRYPLVQVFPLRIYNVHENSYADQVKVVKESRNVKIQTVKNGISNCFPGGASIVHRTVFETHGLFDESLFVGFEDYEYALRCMCAGAELLAVQIDGIELIHDHKVQCSNLDRKAVEQRYNEQKIQQSFERIVTKYDINFDHNWEWWTRKQKADMTGGSRLKKLTSFVKKHLGVR